MDKDASWKVGSIASAMPGVRNYIPAQACNPLSVLRRLWGEAECPLFVLERKIADAPTRLKYVSSDVNALNLQD